MSRGEGRRKEGSVTQLLLESSLPHEPHRPLLLAHSSVGALSGALSGEGRHLGSQRTQ